MGDKRLQIHCVILSERLDLDRILPFLRQERMITRDEYEVLTNMVYTKKQRRERLIISILPRKGKYHFENFGKCLVWSGQVELARHIGVDVDSVPPCPSLSLPEQSSSTGSNQDLLDALRGLVQEHSANGSSASVIPNSHSNLPPGDRHGPSFSPSHVAGQPSQIPERTGASNSAQGTPNVFSGAQMSNPGQGTPNVFSGAQMSNPGQGTLNTSSAAGGDWTAGQSPRLDPALLPHVQRPQGPVKVFILYCKDETLQQEYGTTYEQFFQDVLELADILTYCGGLKCIIDIYEQNQQQNWNIWTQHMIEESTYVVMVCSPQLQRHLSKKEREDIHMYKGLCFSDMLVNTVAAPKFVPVFLNHCKPANPKIWLPPQLHAARFFWLRHLQELYQNIHAQEYNDLERSQILSEKLGDLKHNELASLVRHLRGELSVVAPSPPSIPVQLPPKHNSPISQHHVVDLTTAEYISNETFIKIAQRLPRDWIRLGVKLGVEYSLIKRLQQENASDYVLAVLEVFRIWQQTMGRGATKRVLKRALVEMNFGRLADECFANIEI